MHTTATYVQPKPLARELRPVWVISAVACRSASAVPRAAPSRGRSARLGRDG